MPTTSARLSHYRLSCCDFGCSCSCHFSCGCCHIWFIYMHPNKTSTTKFGSNNSVSTTRDSNCTHQRNVINDSITQKKQLEYNNPSSSLTCHCQLSFPIVNTSKYCYVGLKRLAEVPLV
mmetsp:Transcript_92300/g.193019  ORF Transcript_92300/g.193019 Transcript_92300/m.193019 type:complete len:119 (-) Transcript_92300:349-705(-)